MKTCYLSHACPYYNSGGNKPPNNHVRLTVPCVKFLDMTCQMELDIRLFFKETVACKVKGVK